MSSGVTPKSSCWVMKKVEVALEVPLEDHVREHLGQFRGPVLALPERLFASLANGDALDIADDVGSVPRQGGGNFPRFVDPLPDCLLGDHYLSVASVFIRIPADLCRFRGRRP